MSKRAGVGVGFLVAAACGIALGLLVPPLLPFVALGIALGIAPAVIRLFRREIATWRRPSRQGVQLALAGTVALLGCAAAAVGLFGVAIQSSPPSGAPAPAHRLPFETGNAESREGAGKGSLPSFFKQFRTDTLEVTYSGEGIHQSDPERLELTDRLLIRRSALTRTPARELQALAAGMAAQHWRPLERTGSGLIFQRHREVALHSRTFPPETGNTIELPRVAVEDRHDRVRTKLLAGSGSRLTLVASADTFGPSFPQGVRETRPASGLEQIAIPVAASRQVEVDLRSPLFRNELLAGFADGSLFSVLRWVIGLLVAAVIALFNEELKKRLGRLLSRLRRRPRPAAG